MVRRKREIPSVGIMRIGEHYVVHAGCKTEVFHFPSEVGLFLEGLLRDWIRDNLGGDTTAIETEKNPIGPCLAMTRERI
jgi:hypothetical protein